MSREKWKPILGHPGFFVSNLGRVDGPRGVNNGQSLRNGYPRVILSDRRAHSIHRLVASAFCDGAGPQVNHKNGIKTDNRAENLEWCTASENHRHRYRVLGHGHWLSGKTGENCPFTKVVVAVYPDGRRERYMGTRDAVANGPATNIGHVSSCCTGKRLTHAGLRWEYEDNGVRWDAREEE